MPDKDYIKKIYSFMTSAYGDSGALSKGAFRGSFDDFYNKISSDEKYADKIQNALSIAYGPNGGLKKGTFSLDPVKFRERVLTPKPQFETAQQFLGVTKPPQQEHPAIDVLRSGTEIETPAPKEKGLLSDIGAFEPVIQAKEKQEQEDLNKAVKEFNENLRRPYQPEISMTPKTNQELMQEIAADPAAKYQTEIRASLAKLDEEDNNRLAAQATADELYKTPQGRMYYNFIRPIYKSALNQGSNALAFGARLFNADNVADKIVDYFDFDRLAREGNPSAALNMEPSKQHGKLGMSNIIPKAVEGLTNMGIMMSGGAVAGGSKAALMGTSFVTQYENYRQEAINAGLSAADADKYAITGAGLTSMLELVSPNEIITKGITPSLAKESVFKAIKGGVPVATAIKTGLKNGLKEIGKENAQELAQVIGDNAVRYGFDTMVLNDPKFHQDNILPTAQQALETMVLTTIATGVVSSPRLLSKNKASSLERSAWATAAENPQIVEDGLNKALSENAISQEKAGQIKNNVAEYKQIYDALSAKGYDKETVERMAINAYRAKKIDEQNKPIAGIPVLNAITSQDEATKIEIEKDILSAAAGEPEADYDSPEANTPSEITIQQPGEIARPQVITVGENITEPVKTEDNAILEQTTNESVLRQEQPEVGLQEVVKGDAEPEIPSAEGQQVQEEVTARRNAALGDLKIALENRKKGEEIPDAEQAEIQSLFESNRTTPEIVESIGAMANEPFLNQQIKTLMPYLNANPEIKFSKMFSVGRGEAHYTGDWTVLLSHIKDKAQLAHTVVHELYHAVSMNELVNNPKFESEIDGIVQQARKKLGVEDYFKDAANTDFGASKDNKYYGLLNAKEFIAEIFSNKDFSQMIDGIKIGDGKKSLLIRVIDYIKRAVGIKGQSTSEQIRKSILKGIDTKISFSGDDLSKRLIEGQRKAARQSDFKYAPADRGKLDQAKERLRGAWDQYKTSGIVNDPQRNLQRDKEFYSALVNYVKQELLYRANQVKGFAQQKKSQVKRAISKSLKDEGVVLDDVSMLNDAFEEAYEQTKKIPGVLPDEANDRVSFRQYIKDRFKVREIGRKTGVKEGRQQSVSNIKEARKVVQESLKGTGAKLTIPELRSINTMLQRAAGAKDQQKAVDRVAADVSQIIWEAKNRGKIASAKRAIRAIGKLKKSKSMVLQDVEWIKGLNFPAPSKVDDLDTYLDMLKDFTQSRKGNELNPKYTKEEISEFVDQENERIYKEKRESQQSNLDDLKEQGVIADDVTLDEYIGMLDAVPNKASEGISPKAEILKNSLKERLGMLKDRLPEFEGRDKALVTELSNIDTSYLNPSDLVRLNNVLNNIAEFGTLDAAGDIVTSYKAKKAVEELERSKDKIRELSKMEVLNKKNLSNFMSALFYNDNAISNFRAKTIGLIEKKVSRVKNQAQNVVKEFVQLSRRNKIDGLANNKLHAFSYLNQYRGNDRGEITDDLRRRLDDLVSDARYILSEANRVEGKAGDAFRREAMHRFEAMADLGLIDYSINELDPTEDLMVNIKERFDDPEASLRDIERRLSDGEKEVYQFARDHYDSLSDQMEDVTRNYAGKIFQRERNYISLVPRKKRVADDKNPEISADTDILQGLKSVNAKPSSTTISRSAKKPENVYYESDFFSNFINRYYTSLYTAEALPELQTVAKVVNDPKFEKFLTGQFDEGFRGEGKDNFQKFKEKISEAINEEKYSPFFKRGKSNIFDDVVNKGVRLVLGNVWQGPKQYGPATLHNLVVNDNRALRYALKSRGLALSPNNKEYAEARQELLNHFTGVQRSAVGSNAYDEYIKRIDEDMAWWQHPLEWLDKVRGLSSFVLEKADKAAQNDAYISSYITSLLKDGKIKSVKDFDIYEHARNPDQKALAYAEQIASNINNESAKAYRPKVLKDPASARNLWLLQGFSLNAYQSAMNKAKIIFDNRATSTEKKEAANHFLGYLAELASYQLVGKWARNLQSALAIALLAQLFKIDIKEDKEVQKEKKTKDNIRIGANMFADLTMSGLPAPYQTAAKITLNYAFAQWAKIRAKELKAEAKERGEKFDPRGTFLSPYFKPYIGAEGPGGAAEFYTSAGQKIVDAVTKAANENDESKEETETEKLMTNLNRYLGIPAVAIGSGDLFILNNRMQQALREKAAADKKKRKETSTGHGRGHRRNIRINTNR